VKQLIKLKWPYDTTNHCIEQSLVESPTKFEYLSSVHDYSATNTWSFQSLTSDADSLATNTHSPRAVESSTIADDNVQSPWLKH